MHDIRVMDVDSNPYRNVLISACALSTTIDEGLQSDLTLETLLCRA